jgi:hypothetical protein
MLLLLRSLYDRNSAAVGVSQAPAVVAAVVAERLIANGAVAQVAAAVNATLLERFVVSAIAPGQAAAAVSASLREDFVLSAAAIAQAPATVSGAVVERFIASVAIGQVAGAVSGTAVERFILASVGPAQAPAVIAATLNAAAGTPTLSIAVTQPAAAVAATLGGGTEPVFQSFGGGASGYQPGRIVRPAKPTAAPITIAAAVVQRPAIAALHLATNDDLAVLGLDDDGLLDLAA